MKIVFCHGLEGSSNGIKAKFILDSFEENHRVLIPKLTKSLEFSDFSCDLDELEKIVDPGDIVIGSSRGGALVAALPTPNVHKILIAPAVKKFNVEHVFLHPADVILHSKNDDAVDFRDSAELSLQNKCVIIEAGNNHRMSDTQTLSLVKNLITQIILQKSTKFVCIQEQNTSGICYISNVNKNKNTITLIRVTH